MGVYITNKSIFDYIPANAPYGFNNLMLDLLDEKISVLVEFFDG